jgi:hypothetical protein
MGRAAAAFAVLILACAVAVAVPAGSSASPKAEAAAKCKRKHRHHPRKRCRRPSGSAVTGGLGSGAPPGRLLATEREISPSQLQLQLSRAALPAGTAIVEQYNAGSDPHNLVAEREGSVYFSFPTLDPGGDQRQTVTLKQGTYTLYCSLLNHRELGMQATLTVN